jgi:hypothetical protein
VLDRWGLHTEFLAQLLEVMSVTAAEKRLKDTIKVPRPEHLRPRRKAAPSHEATKRGIAILAATARPRR